MDHTIGIGDFVIVDNLEDRIITHALGSCVAVTVYCPKSSVGAMIHIALPRARLNKSDVDKPGYYADIGLQKMLDQLKFKYNCNDASLQIKVVGGANSIRESDSFKIGPQNLEEVFKILNQNGLKYDDTETSGNVSRTIVLELKTGLLAIKKQPLII